MAHTPPLLLLHGAWHRGAAWEAVAALLRQRGHQVLAPDLPGHGTSPYPPRKVNLRVYVEAVLAQLDALGEPACVAAHSMAGMILAQCCSDRPEAIRRALYLCAYLPCDGDSVFDLIARNRGASAPQGIELALQVSDDKRTCTVDPALAPGLFYNALSPRRAQAHAAALGTQSMLALAARVKLDAGRFAQVPRSYVSCTQDRVIPLAHQHRMLAHQPCEQLLQIEADHSPFLSQPAQLAALFEASLFDAP
ncbi:MAG TPA: alpha/beta hydrolase [Hyphomicrobiales bacterium]|nr:alpha/beta hydrolase [Hyphomicrobiales bacterium]